MKHTISIITVNYNDASGLGRTIESVVGQVKAPDEFIVIDGGSSDGSSGIISDNESHLSSWVSEPDNGVYHAMNKGLRMANGDYVLFLNSGDTFASEQTLEQISKRLGDAKDLYYGDAVLMKGETRGERRAYPSQLRFSYLAHATVVHQAQLIKRKLFDEVSYYNEDRKFASDWEFLIRAVCLHQATHEYLAIPFTAYNLDGMSSDEANEDALKEERNAVLERYFPAFINDFNELQGHRKRRKNSRFQKFLELEGHPVGRSLNALCMSMYLGIYGILGKRKRNGK